MPSGAWPTFAPAQSIIVTPTFTTSGSVYYNTTYDLDMKPYTVTFNTSMTYENYCSYQSYQTKIILYTDCSAIPYITSSYQSNPVNLTPATYKTYEYLSSSDIGSKKIKLFPGIILCTQQCHSPSLGSSPKHIVDVRKAGTTTWVSNIYTDLATHTYPSGTTLLTVGDVYEFRSRGQINTSGDMSGYSSVHTIIVQ